uniref:Uncharacterized protein n=1 Tax=Anguilla anguilla TaxID=7936 RepID=A0A0E9WHF4_ANGAN
MFTAVPQACEEKGTMLKLNRSKTTTTLRWESNPGFFFFFCSCRAKLFNVSLVFPK